MIAKEEIICRHLAKFSFFKKEFPVRSLRRGNCFSHFFFSDPGSRDKGFECFFFSLFLFEEYWSVVVCVGCGWWGMLRT